MYTFNLLNLRNTQLFHRLFVFPEPLSKLSLDANVLRVLSKLSRCQWAVRQCITGKFTLFHVTRNSNWGKYNGNKLYLQKPGITPKFNGNFNGISEFPLLTELPEITWKFWKEMEILVKTPEIPLKICYFWCPSYTWCPSCTYFCLYLTGISGLFPVIQLW